MNRTRSRPSASRAASAIARWPRWIGSNVPPMTPDAPAGRAGPAVTARCPGLGLPLELDRADADGVAGLRRPARRSSASMPRRSRSRWKRSADSSTSKFVWAARRSMRWPRTRTRRPRRARPRSRRPWPRGDGRRRPPARAARPAPRRSAGARASAARSSSSPSPLGGGDADDGQALALARAAANAGQASAAAARSSLLKATSIGFSRSAGSWASQLLADDVVVPLRVARRRRRRRGRGPASARRGAGRRGRGRRRRSRPR